MTETAAQITADDLRSLRAADYPAVLVLVEGDFDHGPTAVMADVTALEGGYRVLATAVEVYEAYGSEPMSDAELEALAEQLNTARQ